MSKPSTEELTPQLAKFEQVHNDAVQTQQQCKEKIIAIQAVILDREDGDTNNSTSTDSEN